MHVYFYSAVLIWFSYIHSFILYFSPRARLFLVCPNFHSFNSRRKFSTSDRKLHEIVFWFLLSRPYIRFFGAIHLLLGCAFISWFSSYLVFRRFIFTRVVFRHHMRRKREAMNKTSIESFSSFSLPLIKFAPCLAFSCSTDFLFSCLIFRRFNSHELFYSVTPSWSVN